MAFFYKMKAECPRCLTETDHDILDEGVKDGVEVARLECWGCYEPFLVCTWDASLFDREGVLVDEC
jgi:hypothetical protein